MDRALLRVEVGRGRSSPAQVAALRTALRAALDGSGPGVAPGDGSSHRLSSTVPAEVALAVPTSGSTGRPRTVLLDRAALHASATATHARLGGPGTWLLALPLGHVAGLQVLIRSIVAGTTALTVPEPADGQALVTAAAAAARYDAPVYTSLVPTQLERLVAAVERGELAVPAVDAVLVGGAATAPTLLDRAEAVGLSVVTTYGMTETSGGCVYDGVPLDGVDVRLDRSRITIAGTVLARGYLDDDPAQQAAFVERDGVRRLVTQDVGELVGGRLTVLGRVDDMLISGGHNVPPAAVEAVLAGLAGVDEVCVVGVPDAEWGQAVVAVVVAAGPPPDLATVRAAVRRTLGPAAAPRHLLLVESLPLRGPGKPDRAALTATATAVIGAAPGLSSTTTTRTEHDGHDS